MLATVGFAQSMIVATLSHENNITTFFGPDALKSAHSAATDGDCITLSSGQFNAVDITKAVTIRGAGMEEDSILGIKPTIIYGTPHISITDNGTDRLRMEGFYLNGNLYYEGTLESPTFVKCRFGEFIYTSQNSAYLKNASFIHCKIATRLLLSAISSAFCTSCIISNPYLTGSSTSNIEIYNSVVLLTGDGSSSLASVPVGIHDSSLNNCIIYVTSTSSSNYSFPSSTTLYNNVSNQSNAFNNCLNTTNQVAEMDSLFLHFTTEVDNSDYTLTDEAKSTYLGTDGTEVGIYGGIYPYNPVPTNLRVTRCSVATQSSSDGTLSVDIEVNGGQ